MRPEVNQPSVNQRQAQPKKTNASLPENTLYIPIQAGFSGTTGALFPPILALHVVHLAFSTSQPTAFPSRPSQSTSTRSPSLFMCSRRTMPG